jgi:biotin carboxylase
MAALIQAEVVARPTAVDQNTAVAASGQGIRHVVLICHLGRAGYNLQRALQAIGVRSYLVYDNRAASVRWSWGTTALHRTADLDTADPVLIADKINQLHRDINICSVIPTDVQATLLLAKMLPLLTAPVFPTPDPDTLRRLDDKWEFAKICMTNGIAIPKTLFFRTNTEFDPVRIECELGYPAIIKPSVGFGQRNIVVLRNAQDATAFKAASSHPNGMVVQEYVEGRDWSLSVLAREGIVTHLTAWECPPQLGKSYGVARFMTTTFRHHDQLINMGKDVVAATRLSGVANFDARLSPDGRMVLFECNPRFFNRMLAARMCGLNFVAAGLPGYSLHQQNSLTAGDYYPWQELFTWRGLKLLLSRRWKLRHLISDLSEMLRDPLPPLIRKLTGEDEMAKP